MSIYVMISILGLFFIITFLCGLFIIENVLFPINKKKIIVSIIPLAILGYICFKIVNIFIVVIMNYHYAHNVLQVI